MSVSKLSLRQKIAFNLFRKYRISQTKLHQLSYLMWECTLRCNLACKHCGSDCTRDATKKDMPLKDFLKVIDNITPHVDTHNTMIVITGGEPLMRTDLEECGRELYKREFPWGIVSNGLAMTEKRLDSLLAAGLRSTTISLDGLKETHNQFRGNPQSFQKAIEAIQLLVKNKEHLIFDVVTCVSQYNYDELEGVKQLLIDIGVERWRVFTVFPIGRATEDPKLQLPPKKFKQLFDFIKKTREEGEIKLSYGCEGFLGSYDNEVRDNMFFCKAGINIGSVLVDGSIGACPNLRENFIQGNIYKDESYIDVWNERYQIFRDKRWMKQGICSECKEWKYCEGNGMHLRDEEGNLALCHLRKLEEGEKES